MQDINKIVLEAFATEFPGAPESEIQELIQEIGQTIIVESMAKVVEAIEEKDPEKADEVKRIIEDNDAGAVIEISKVCEDLNIDLEQIYQEVAADVVKDVLEK